MWPKISLLKKLSIIESAASPTITFSNSCRNSLVVFVLKKWPLQLPLIVN